MNILDLMSNPKIFGKTFALKKKLLQKPTDTWKVWRVFLSALFGLQMTAEQLEVFRRHTARDDVPKTQFREAFLICGRRSGKSIVAALIAVFLACFKSYDDVLAPGEKGVLMVLSADRRQSKIIFRYIDALLQAPILKSMVVSRLKESIELSNGIIVEIHTSNFRSVRGATVVGCVADECAFWQDENSSNPDVEVFAAIRPAMATIPGALLIGISSPYAKKGVLWQAHKEHFGKRSTTLVWQSDSRSMNPTLPVAVIQDAYRKDPSSAKAEYGAQFRDDIESFISTEVVEANVIAGRKELPYIQGKRYFGFVDPSGGVSDSFTMGIAHCEKEKAVLDLLREVQAPLSPKLVAAEFAQVLKLYRIGEVEGDRYGGEWPREEFEKHGVSYRPSDKSKNDLYLSFLPGLMGHSVELLDNPKLVAQLTGLERRTGRLHDTIDHAEHGHDDVANCAAGVLSRVMREAMGGQLGVLGFFQKVQEEIRQGIRDVFGERIEPVPEPVPAPKPKPVEPKADQADKPDLNQQHPPCPHCGSTATAINGPGYLCNQCGGRMSWKGEPTLPPPSGIVVGKNCCPAPLLAKAGGGDICNNCGKQSPPAFTVGASFKDLKRRRF